MIAPGEPLPERALEVKAESMPVWAAALRDPNPIHVDPAATRAAGLGDRVINQGPANVGYLVNILLDRFPGAAIESLDFRFLDNVRAGDVAVASGVVEQVLRKGGSTRVECRLRLEVEGRTVLSGNAWLDVAD